MYIIGVNTDILRRINEDQTDLILFIGSDNNAFMPAPPLRQRLKRKTEACAYDSES